MREKCNGWQWKFVHQTPRNVKRMPWNASLRVVIECEGDCCEKVCECSLDENCDCQITTKRARKVPPRNLRLVW